MAYLIFSKKQNLTPGDLYRIAETDEHLNALNILQNDYIIKTISIEDFNNFKSENKLIESINGDQITFANLVRLLPMEKAEFDATLQENKDYYQNILNEKKEKQTILGLVENALNSLNNIDTSTISFPLNKTCYQYLHSQSIYFIHPLQIG